MTTLQQAYYIYYYIVFQNLRIQILFLIKGEMITKQETKIHNT